MVEVKVQEGDTKIGCRILKCGVQKYGVKVGWRIEVHSASQKYGGCRKDEGAES